MIDNKLHTQIVSSVDEFGNKRETKIIGNRKYVTVWYENGNKMCEEEYKNGKEEGKWIGWHEDGNKKYEGEFKNGENGRKWIGWWEDGNRKIEGEFKDEKSEGK